MKSKSQLDFEEKRATIQRRLIVNNEDIEIMLAKRLHIEAKQLVNGNTLRLHMCMYDIACDRVAAADTPKNQRGHDVILGEVGMLAARTYTLQVNRGSVPKQPSPATMRLATETLDMFSTQSAARPSMDEARRKVVNELVCEFIVRANPFAIASDIRDGDYREPWKPLGIDFAFLSRNLPADEKAEMLDTAASLLTATCQGLEHLFKEVRPRHEAYQRLFIEETPESGGTDRFSHVTAMTKLAAGALLEAEGEEAGPARKIAQAYLDGLLDMQIPDSHHDTSEATPPDEQERLKRVRKKYPTVRLD